VSGGTWPYETPATAIFDSDVLIPTGVPE